MIPQGYQQLFSKEGKTLHANVTNRYDHFQGEGWSVFPDCHDLAPKFRKRPEPRNPLDMRIPVEPKSESVDKPVDKTVDKPADNVVDKVAPKPKAVAPRKPKKLDLRRKENRHLSKYLSAGASMQGVTKNDS